MAQTGSAIPGNPLDDITTVWRSICPVEVYSDSMVRPLCTRAHEHGTDCESCPARQHDGTSLQLADHLYPTTSRHGWLRGLLLPRLMTRLARCLWILPMACLLQHNVARSVPSKPPGVDGRSQSGNGGDPCLIAWA